MNTSVRRHKIMDYIKRDGQVQVRDLVEQFGVSEMTVRRDLEHLADEGLVVRTYGGAVTAPALTREQPYAAKAAERTSEKERIARRAATLIRNGDVVLLDAGSTTAALARCLHGYRDLTVVTVDLKIALELSDEPGIRVLVTGGTAQPEGYNLYGPLAEQTLRSLTVDLAFLGTSSVDIGQGVTTPTLDKVPLKQSMLRATRRSVLLADSNKFGRRSSFQICRLEALHHIITDDGLPADTARAIQKEGVTLDLV
ncbi:MAG TPA: DeoR/GlpR family DNA-binding transcription regulator [Symbiobacteriaceae bacterium]|jgi:DeoR family transcriptional regulator, fructose operon transcriptional repressor|nr:DeoR/GlpR family DNA-binding transcription regulator [Symbiobacteriaceae bacterium]